MAYVYLNYHLLVICKRKEMKNLEDIAIERVGKMLQGDTFVHDDVVCCTLSDAENSYVAGYQDAVSKTIKWLMNHLYVLHADLDYVASTSCDTVDDFIDDFKRYMEE